MKTNLIIDGNYILSKLVFTLHKNNLLFGALETSLDNAIKSYRRLYPFTKIYLVSDTRGSSWRKKLLTEYKAQRKKDSEIDWDFVYSTYQEVKLKLKGIKVLEYSSIEGDDFISYLVNESNKNGQSTIIISNDHDIKQLLKFSIDPLYINIMINEMFNKQKVFLSENYRLFLSEIKKIDNDDIFNLNDNREFIKLIDGFINKYDINEVNIIKSLLVKVISGDNSDNIPSIYQVTKNGKTRGIGSIGAEKIVEEYIKEFGEIILNDPDLYENIADLVCEKKKAPKTEINNITNRISENMQLIDLRLESLPKEIVEKIKSVYES